MPSACGSAASEQPPNGAIKAADLLRYGQAELVLYQDGNRNGNLDVIGRDQPALHRVVGRANGFRAWWLTNGRPTTCDGSKEGGPLDLPVANRPVKITCNGEKTIYGWRDCAPRSEALRHGVLPHRIRQARSRKAHARRLAVPVTLGAIRTA